MIKQNLVIKNPRMCIQAYKKYAGMHILGFVITKFCLFMFEKNISESALFHPEMVGLTNFRPDIAVCIVNVMISNKNIFQNSSGSVLMNC